MPCHAMFCYAMSRYAMLCVAAPCYTRLHYITVNMPEAGVQQQKTAGKVTLGRSAMVMMKITTLNSKALHPN